MKKIIIIFGVASCSLSAILVRFSTAPSTVLVFYRMLLSVLFLLPGIFGLRKELVSLNCKHIGMCICSGLFLGIHFMCYFASLKLTSIASSVVLVDTEVFFVAIGGILFLQEKLSKIGWGCILLTFAGSVIVAMGDVGNGHILGDLVALLGAVCVSVYTMIGRKLRKEISTTIYTWIVYLTAAMVVFVISMATDTKVYPISYQNLLIAVGLCVFCTLLGHSIFSWGLKYEKAAFISNTKLLEPVFATILGGIIFREIPSLTTCVGGVMIIVGIVMFSLQTESE